MRARAWVTATLLFLSTAGAVHAQCADPFDSLLCADRTEFADDVRGAVDSAASTFWERFPPLDSVVLRAPRHCRNVPCGISDSSDAEVVVRAAAGPWALHVLVLVRDDHWTVPDTNDATGDVLEIALDPVSLNTMLNCGDCFLDSLSVTSKGTVLGFWMGGASAATGPVRVTYYEQYLDSIMSFAVRREAVELFWSIAVDSWELLPGQRGLELAFDWGLGPLTPEQPELSLRRMAMAVSYIDRDSGGVADTLRWAALPVLTRGGSPDSCWGQIRFPDTLAWCPYMEPEFCGGSAVQPRAFDGSLRSVPNQQRYLLNGRVLPLARAPADVLKLLRAATRMQ